MDERPGRPRFFDAVSKGWRDLATYLGAGAGYIVIGVAVPGFMFSLAVAVAYLLACVVAIPALARRLRR